MTMSESIIAKKQRILGNALEGSPKILEAVRSGLWTAQDASEYRKHIAEGLKRSSHAERVKMTMRGVPRTVRS
jgi:hypothetical protein